ncbi:MAG TPA: alpha/beta hydrolase [Coleofasciculaceae cyanobacterium]|jgi:pimeloyl-[acyl-carrier protein] methyl ester esterase
MNSPVAIAYHGWGFDASCWRSWEQQFDKTKVRFQAFDRGYFGCPAEASFGQAVGFGQPASFERSPKILLAHSYGLHLCPIAQLQQADLLVIFSSFSEFHPQRVSLRRRSQAILQLMLNQLDANPQLVLENFRSKCYFPHSEAVQPEGHLAYNLELLISDLIHLGNTSLSLAMTGESWQQIPKIIFHGTQDQIVSPDRVQALLNLLGNAEYIEIPDAGHALPFTHVQTCWSALNTYAAYFS